MDLKSIPFSVVLALIGATFLLLAAGLQIPVGEVVVRLDGGPAKTVGGLVGAALIAIAIFLEVRTKLGDTADVKSDSHIEAKDLKTPSWNDVLLTAEKVLVKIEGSGWKPDLILGLGRSGALWGGWFAGNLGSLPIAVIDISYRDTQAGRVVTFPVGALVLDALREVYGSALNVLAIEGASSTGQTITEFMAQYKQRVTGWDMKFAVLYKNRAVATRIDFVGGTLDPWPNRLPWHLRPVYRPHMNGSSDA